MASIFSSDLQSPLVFALCFGNIPSTPTTIDITSSFIFHNFFSASRHFHFQDTHQISQSLLNNFITFVIVGIIVAVAVKVAVIEIAVEIVIVSVGIVGSKVLINNISTIFRFTSYFYFSLYSHSFCSLYECFLFPLQNPCHLNYPITSFALIHYLFISHMFLFFCSLLFSRLPERLLFSHDFPLFLFARVLCTLGQINDTSPLI